MKANIQKGIILVALTILGAVVLSGAVAADDTTTNEIVITDPPQDNPADEGTGNMEGATDPEYQESGSSDGNSGETSQPEETPADPTEADPPDEDTGDSGNSADPVEETESSDGNSVEPFQVPEDDPADLSITKTFLDAYWNPITTANMGDLVYVLINVVNNGPDPAIFVAMTDLPTMGLTPFGTYWTSYDDGATWNYNDGSFSAEGGLWFRLGMDAGDSYWLAALYQVTATGTIENTATVASLIPDPNPDNNIITAELDVLEADLYVEKYFLDWETFNPINEANYLDDLWTRVVVENLGPDTAQDVYIYDYLPAGIDVNSIWRTSKDGGITWNYFDPDVEFIWNLIIWEAGDMDAGEVFILDIGSRVEISDELLLNEASADSITYDPDPDDNWDIEWLEIGPAVDVYVDKEFVDRGDNPISTADYGDTVYADYLIGNNGPDTATNLELVDYLPDGLEYNGDWWVWDGLHWIYKDPNYQAPVYDAINNIITWNAGDLLINGSLWFSLGLDVVKSGTLENYAEVEADQYDWFPANNEDSDSLFVPGEADVWITKEVSNISQPGEPINYLDYIEYLITVGNNGPDTSYNVWAWDIIVTGFDLDTWSVSWDGGTTWISEDPSFDPTTGWWEIGDLADDTEVLLSLEGTVVNSDFELYNYADAYGDTYDPNLDNNWDEITIQVPPAADIGVEKTLNPLSDVNYQGYIDFIVTVYNNGPDMATDIIVTDTLPEGLEWFGYGGWFSQYKSFALTGYNPITREITWKILDPIAPGEFGILNIWGVYVNTSNVTVYNTVEVEGEEYDYNLLNNEDTLPIEIPPAADIWVTKEIIDATQPYDTINYLDLVHYLITVGNNGPDTATGITMTENINFTQFELDTWAVSWDGGVTWIDQDPTYNPLTGIWNIGTLQTDDPNPELLIIGWIIDSNTTMTNQATVQANEYDPHPENNTAQLEFDVPPAADLEVIKDTSNYTPTIGSTFYFTIELFNWGPDAAQNIVVADFMDPGIILLEAIPSVGYFDYGDWTWNIDELPAGEGAQLILICMVEEIGSITNEVEVYSDTYDPDMSNNYSEVTVIGQPKPHVPCKKPCMPCVQAGKVPMQPTGSPLAGLALAVLAILGGLVSSRR